MARKRKGSVRQYLISPLITRASYIKDLEDMLGKIADAEFLLDEARDLLECPRPACEIDDETCRGEVGQPVGHDLWFCEEHR